MEKIDISGWGKVFRFTFVQTVKTRSYRITLAILCLLLFIGIPVIGYMNYDGSSDAADVSVEEHVRIEKVDKIYISYENNTDIDELMKKWSERYSCTVQYLEPEQVGKVTDTFNDSEASAIVIEISYTDGVYSADVISGWNAAGMMDDMDTIAYGMADDLKELQMKGVIDPSVMEKAVKEVNAYTVGGEESDNEGFMSKYFIWLACITILTFVVTFSGQSLATSVVTEKSSKLVEYLLLSIRPMALVTGKMAAAFASLCIQLGAVILSGILSIAVSGMVLGFDMGKVVGNLISGGDISSAFGGVNALSVIIAVIVIILGVVFFLFIAGIAGASVSKMEEMNEGMVMFTMLVIVGAYMSLALSMSNVFNENGQLSGTFAMVCCLLPISSIFTVPANLMMGSVSAVTGLLSILILVAGNVLMLVITSKIYEYLLFYNGVTLKIRDIIHIIRYGRVKEAK